MTIAFWCVLVAALLPYMFALGAKWTRRYDNARPRSSIEQNQGWRLRAHWAHLNSFEAFGPFAAAVIINHLAKGPSAAADTLALAFIGLRLVYAALYVADKPTARSLVWTAGIACVVALFVNAA
ncbi:hypothetical protein C3942_03595 [Solimonas fluminis]|uniref:MAPEG family protein n=1 Tax=Solimonas fluminis TaxID=2086571 RepID=A0A2S5TLW1_9GAMM|nr:MAPEG family protein [Solimonas fluminis]PPE75976.1 hypothetical protein C3942_03595 [Solimonas fluminis]